MKRKYNYQVFYILKHRRSNELRHLFIYAENQRDAIEQCRDLVRTRYGRYAFHVTPIRDDCPDDILHRKMQDLYWYDPSAAPAV